MRFPGPTDDSSSPYEASYGFGDLSGGQTVTAFNGVGLTASSPFTVTPDTAEPSGGSVGYPNGYDADGDVTITVDPGTDALSGIAAGSAVLERRTAPLADGACDPFAGAWNAATSPDTVASGLCAQYRYRVSDRVGNEAVYTSAHVVKVDLVNPAAPVLTLDESSPYAHVVGTEIFVNTNQSGSYDVERFHLRRRLRHRQGRLPRRRSRTRAPRTRPPTTSTTWAAPRPSPPTIARATPPRPTSRSPRT